MGKGKKYIIELLDDCQSEFKGIMAFGLTQEKQISVELIPEESLRPYTEPDIEQVRKEAYEQGLSDAWETVKELFSFTFDEQATIFKTTSVRDTVRKYSAYEAIEKIRQYEQEEQITKGDIVLIKSTPEVEILVTYADEEYVSGIALTEVDGNCEIGDQYTNIRISNVEKTGKHYDIVSVLQKMRGSE